MSPLRSASSKLVLVPNIQFSISSLSVSFSDSAESMVKSLIVRLQATLNMSNNFNLEKVSKTNKKAVTYTVFNQV